MDRGKYLDRELYGYGRSEVYPFHMPGHKRQAVTEYLSNPYLEDITEITDFDNLLGLSVKIGVDGYVALPALLVRENAQVQR